jgi:16S rRNA (adenine1518-N6/adenine1519-N6)-dimethyltransferase
VNNLTLIHTDALQYFKEHVKDWSAWKLVANLPYSVASPLLVELALGGNGPQRMVTTLQLEVAKRIIAKADTDEYGVLTLLLRLDYQAQIAFRVPSSCFFPAPDVESSCVVLEKRIRPLLTPASRQVYVKLVKLAFSQRRKMMLKLLKSTWPEETLQQAFANLRLAPDVRAEKVGLEGFVALAEQLTG